jgi:hypothetical protein
MESILGPLGTAGHSWHIVPVPGDYEAGEFSGMDGFGRGIQSTRRKPAPMPLCPPQIPLARTGREPGRRGGKPATISNEIFTVQYIISYISASEHTVFIQLSDLL